MEILRTLGTLGSYFPEGRDELLELEVASNLLELLAVEDLAILEAALGCLRVFLNCSDPRNKVLDLFTTRPDRLLRLIDLMDASPMALELACDVMIFSDLQITALSDSELGLLVPVLLAALDSLLLRVRIEFVVC